MNTSEQEAFEALHAATVQRVMAYCLRHAGPHAAEDVVAETYAIAWRKRAQLPDDPMGWLILTARQEIYTDHRRRMRQRQTAERILPLREHVAASPEGITERRSQLVASLEALPDDDREALLLIAWDGLSIRDAARVLGTTPGALRTRISRARARLRAAQPDVFEGATHA